MERQQIKPEREGDMRKTIWTSALLVLLTTAVGAPRAWADSPHFLYADATILTNTGSLMVVFKEAGLGLTALDEAVTLRVGFAAAEYQCFNGGGKHPSANNKQTVSTSLSLTQRFPVSNGETTGRFVTGPVPPGSFSCPNGQDLYLVNVTYARMTVIGSAGDTLVVRPDPVAASLKILVA
jgi:hypothetical protein